MSSTELTAKAVDVCMVLTDLHHPDEETERSIDDLSQLLYHNPQKRSLLVGTTLTHGGVAALVGILRSSQSLLLIAKAARCLTLLVHNNREGVSKLVSCNIIAASLALLLPRPNISPTEDETLVDASHRLSSPPSWQKEWIPVYEATLALLRRLTYHSFNLQQTFVEQGGVKLIIELSCNPEFIESCSSFSEASRKQLATIALGQKFICYAATTPKSNQSAVLKAFTALKTAGSQTSLEYPSYIVDLMSENGDWLSDLLVSSGEVWPSHAFFPKEVTPVWTCVSVTCVEDGGHVWCQFCQNSPKPRIQAMAEALRNLVSLRFGWGCGSEKGTLHTCTCISTS